MQKIVINDASKLAVNQALYSAMCSEDGSVVDDLVNPPPAQDPEGPVVRADIASLVEGVPVERDT